MMIEAQVLSYGEWTVNDGADINQSIVADSARAKPIYVYTSVYGVYGRHSILFMRDMRGT